MVPDFYASQPVGFAPYSSAIETRALAGWRPKFLTDIERAISLAFDDAVEMLRHAEEETLAVVLLFE